MPNHWLDAATRGLVGEDIHHPPWRGSSWGGGAGVVWNPAGLGSTWYSVHTPGQLLLSGTSVQTPRDENGKRGTQPTGGPTHDGLEDPRFCSSTYRRTGLADSPGISRARRPVTEEKRIGERLWPRCFCPGSRSPGDQRRAFECRCGSRRPHPLVAASNAEAIDTEAVDRPRRRSAPTRRPIRFQPQLPGETYDAGYPGLIGQPQYRGAPSSRRPRRSYPHRSHETASPLPGNSRRYARA